jgi:hypothetical protein
MIIQANGKPYVSAAIREKLYAHCALIPMQDSVDNKAGRGIPNALLSIMDTSDIFLEIVDSGNVPCAGATVTSLSMDVIGTSDSLGVVILQSSEYPREYIVSVPGDTERVSIQQSPSYRRVVVNSKAAITVQVRDTAMKPLNSCRVQFIIDDGSGNVTVRVPEDSGKVHFSYGREVPVSIVVTADGYYTPDTLHVILTQQEQVLTTVLTRVPSHSFIVYPNVLKRSKMTGVKASFSYTHYGYASSHVQALICSVDGTLIWKMSRISQPGHPVFFEWSGITNGKKVSPGIYYFVVKFNGESYRQKFLIAE